MSDPAGLGDPLLAELHRCFTTEELVELTLDVTGWNHQKVHVALGIDHPYAEDHLVAFTYGPDGFPRIGAAI